MRTTRARRDDDDRRQPRSGGEADGGHRAGPTAAPAAGPERATELRVAETVGGLMDFWGFKRPMGRIWTLLFLSPEPLTAADIAARLTMSAGAVSMTLGELVKWGAVKKTWRPGDRRDHYEAETSIWKLVTRVIRERELTLVREAAEVFGEAASTLGRAGDARAEFARERLGQLAALARLGETLLSGIVAGQPVDPARLKDIAPDGKGA